MQIVYFQFWICFWSFLFTVSTPPLDADLGATREYVWTCLYACENVCWKFIVNFVVLVVVIVDVAFCCRCCCPRRRRRCDRCCDRRYIHTHAKNFDTNWFDLNFYRCLYKSRISSHPSTFVLFFLCVSRMGYCLFTCFISTCRTNSLSLPYFNQALESCLCVFSLSTCSCMFCFKIRYFVCDSVFFSLDEVFMQQSFYCWYISIYWINFCFFFAIILDFVYFSCVYICNWMKNSVNFYPLVRETKAQFIKWIK